jgi:hypothetical protein
LQKATVHASIRRPGGVSLPVTFHLIGLVPKVFLGTHVSEAPLRSPVATTIAAPGKLGNMHLRSLFAVALCAWFPSLALAEISVSTDFEGGSAKVLSIDQKNETVRIMPAGDAARGWPCWWYLKVSGLKPGESLTLEVVPSDAPLQGPSKNRGKPLSSAWAFPQRAAWSKDGKNWQHTEAGKTADDGGMVYKLQDCLPEVWIAWGPPFTPADSQQLVESLAKDQPWAEAFELCKSNGGRSCPAVRLKEGVRPASERLGIWIQARQHAWESGASWVCRGVSEWLAGDDPRAAELRKKCEITIVPIMDIDNTATGNGGKEGVPQDHNRDWTDKPHYAEVAAAQEHLKRLIAESRLAIFVDLHNPGSGDKQPFFYAFPEELMPEPGRRNWDRFFTIARGEISGPLSLAEKPRTSGPSYDPLWKQMSKSWVIEHGNPFTIAATLETSWNTPYSTTEGYQLVGQKMAQAIEKYLRDDPRK